MKDFILLESAPESVKLWYITEILKFAKYLDDGDYSDDFDSFPQDYYDTGTQGTIVTILLKNRIKCSKHTNKLILDLITREDASYDKIASIISSKEVINYKKNNEIIIYTSLLKDFIEINYDYFVSMGSVDETYFIDFDSYYDIDNDNPPRYVEFNSYLLNFIKENSFDLGFVKECETGYALFKDPLEQDVLNDKEIKERLEGYLFPYTEYENETKEQSAQFLNAFYFSGGQCQIPSKDYILIFSKHLKTLARVKTLLGTATSIVALANPFTSTLGVLSLGVFALTTLSSKKDTNNAIQKSLLKAKAEAYHRAKLEILSNLCSFNTQSIASDINDFNKDEIKGSLFYNYVLLTAMHALASDEGAIVNALNLFDLPQILDVKRLDSVLKGKSHKDEIKDLIMSAYEKIDGKYQLIGKDLISDSTFLKNTFETIGYHTISGYLKSFI